MSRASLVATTILALLAGALPAAAGAPAALVFESTSCDLGHLIQGERAECLFTFVNAGEEQLRIFAVDPACGCTSVLLTAPLVPPAGRGGIRVTFDSSGSSGDVTKEISVTSSDPARPTTILSIRAGVEPEVVFEPPQVVFDDIRAGAIERDVAVLVNRRREPIEIRALAVSPGSFSCRVPAWTDATRPLVVEAWDRVEIDVALVAPERLAMPIAGECLFTIQGPRMSVFTLKLLGLPAR